MRRARPAKFQGLVRANAAPRRPAARWHRNGLKQLGITIGGVTIAMVSRESDLELSLEGPHARFAAAADAAPDITVDVVWDGRATEHVMSRENEMLFDSGGVWRLYRDRDLLSFHLTSPKFGASPYARAVVNADFSSATVFLRREWCGRRFYPLQYPLDELLITNWLAFGRGVEVHACGVVDKHGAGYLFAGFSGAGKTTTARLWCQEPGIRVLSDDRIILRTIGSDVWMYGTPWHGDEPLALPERARLRQGFFLRHGAENQATRVGGAQAVMELFARSFPPFFSARGLDFTLSLLSDICSAVPFSNLRFVPDPSVLDFVRTAA